MRFGVMGTGQVGSTIAGKLAALGHDVMLGSREPGGENAKKLGLKVGTHAEAAKHGEWIVDAMPGEHAIDRWQNPHRHRQLRVCCRPAHRHSAG